MLLPPDIERIQPLPLPMSMAGNVLPNSEA
jgi:hypothetical protein